MQMPFTVSHCVLPSRRLAHCSFDVHSGICSLSDELSSQPDIAAMLNRDNKKALAVRCLIPGELCIEVKDVFTFM
jgi:hypothetical protein